MIHKKSLNPISSFLFPVTCLGCGKTGDYLCVSCKKKLEPHPEICPVSHRFSPDFQVHIDHRNEVSYQGIAIGFAYTSLLKKLILQLKYYHRYDVTSFLVGRLSLIIQTNQTLQRLMQKKKVIITSIPSHRYRKYFIKGYNQSELLAKGVAQTLGVQYQPLLTKRKHTRIQAFLSRQQRMKNLESAFKMCSDVILQGDELILIIDDVTTTGSTINTAAKILKKSYSALSIRGVVIGRHT